MAQGIRKTKILKLDKDQHFKCWFEAAYDENFERLYHFAIRITGERQLAEDVVSEVFLNLWNMRESSSTIKELDAYLFISVKNQAIRAVTKDPKKYESLNFENTIKKIERQDPEELLLEKELLQVIEKAVATLPDQCKLVYELVRERNLTYSQAANELGITEGTVKNQLIKAVGRIREQVRAHLLEGQPSNHELVKLTPVALILLYPIESLLLNIQ